LLNAIDPDIRQNHEESDTSNSPTEGQEHSHVVPPQHSRRQRARSYEHDSENTLKSQDENADVGPDDDLDLTRLNNEALQKSLRSEVGTFQKHFMTLIQRNLGCRME
jgi:hypothetical protein